MRLAHTLALLAILAVAALSPVKTSAKTWYVEKDGSADFTVIQNAVDAAAAGDTIRIGPGRFEEFRGYVYPAGVYDICLYNTHSELTVFPPIAEQQAPLLSPIPFSCIVLKMQ